MKLAQTVSARVNLETPAGKLDIDKIMKANGFAGPWRRPFGTDQRYTEQEERNRRSNPGNLGINYRDPGVMCEEDGTAGKRQFGQ